MGIHAALRLTAGAVLIAAVILTLSVSPHFIWLVLFVALNLVQSAFSGWCPAMSILGRFVTGGGSENGCGSGGEGGAAGV